jgi:acyl-CoA synthetase (AMP-forming)/AMP-acid ligase II
MLWGDVIRYWARWQPSQPAVRFEDQTWTWAEHDRATDELAAGLAQRGIGHGDRVGILLGNRPEFVQVVGAVMKLGAIAVPFNVRLTAPELAYQVRDADCAVVVTEDALAAGLDEARAERPTMPVVSADGELDAWRVPGDAPPPVAVDERDPLFICFTSGTTGDPKGAVLTHRSWHFASMSRALQCRISGNDRTLLPFPLAFTGGLAMSMTTLWAGATLVLERAFDPTRCLELIESERITVFMAVPVIFQTLADHPAFPTADLSSWRVASAGGAPVPESLLRTFIARGIPMIQAYSLTEVSAAGTTLPTHDALRKVGSAGVSALHSATRVLREDGTDCAVGEVGEICIKGPEVMAGYWRKPEATAATIVDGWCHTGDLGFLDDEGYLTVVDRAKDMLISGGLNVYPAEIERVLAGLPGVVEVAVVGVPDARWGESPAVVAYGDADQLTPDAVLAACRGRLADYKLPRYLVVRDEPLPRNMSGKVLKRDLRHAYADLPGRAAPIR